MGIWTDNTIFKGTPKKTHKLLKIAKTVRERDSLEERKQVLEFVKSQPGTTPFKMALLELLIIDGDAPHIYQDIPEIRKFEAKLKQAAQH